MTHYIADTNLILFWTTLTLLYVYACVSLPYCDWAESCDCNTRTNVKYYLKLDQKTLMLYIFSKISL